MLEQEMFQEFFTTLLSMSNEQVEKEKDLLFEIFEKSMSDHEIDRRVIELRELGKTPDDLVKENEGLRKLSFPPALELTGAKKEVIEKIINTAIEFNQKIIDKGFRKQINVAVEKCREEAIIPQYANYGDAGIDFITCTDMVIKPNTTSIVPTGLKMAIPLGYELQIRPRSGNSLKEAWQGISIANSPGTIDTGYRGEIGIIIKNSGKVPFAITKGTKIAQGVLAEVPKIEFYEVESVEKIGSNRGGGFGSTDGTNKN